VAQGLRLEKSKLRYHTVNHSFGLFSIVRGKEVCRLTSAQGLFSAQSLDSSQESSGSQSTDASIEPDSLMTVLSADTKEFWARMALLLRRFLHGQEPNEKLFEILYSCHVFLSEKPTDESLVQALSFSPVSLATPSSSLPLSPASLQTIESLTVLRIMNVLGYVGDDEEIHSFIQSHDFPPSLLDLATRKRVVINKHINKAFQESQL
jgi:hypothetical protein